MLCAADLGETSGKADVSLSMAGFVTSPLQRNNNFRAVGAICRSTSSMMGVCTGRREAVGKVERSVSRKEGYMHYAINPVSPVSVWMGYSSLQEGGLGLFLGVRMRGWCGRGGNITP